LSHFFVNLFANAGWSAYLLNESAGIYQEGFKDIHVIDVNFFYLWEVGRQNIRLLRATKLDDLPRLKDDQVAVILEEPCRTEVRK